MNFIRPKNKYKPKPKLNRISLLNGGFLICPSWGRIAQLWGEPGRTKECWNDKIVVISAIRLLDLKWQANKHFNDCWLLHAHNYTRRTTLITKPSHYSFWLPFSPALWSCRNTMAVLQLRCLSEKESFSFF